MYARIYFVLALVGLVATWVFNIRFMQQTGFAFDALEFLRQGFANPASSLPARACHKRRPGNPVRAIPSR